MSTEIMNYTAGFLAGSGLTASVIALIANFWWC